MGNLITPFREVYDFSQPLYMVMGNYIIQEEWKPLWLVIPNIKYGYFVSNFGRVYNAKNNIFLGYCDSKGYRAVGIELSNGIRKTIRVHQLVGMLFVYNTSPEKYKIINHKDGIKLNNFFMNLEWCDNKYNTQHAVNTGLMNISGEDSGMSKLTEKQVHLICKALEDGREYDDIRVNILNNEVTNDAIANIKTGRRWEHISCSYNINKKRFNNQGLNDDELRFYYKYMLQGYDVNYILDNIVKVPKHTKERKTLYMLLYNLWVGRRYKHINNGINLRKINKEGENV